MIVYRPFRNDDHLRFAEIWRSRPPLRRCLQPFAPAALEAVILGKPYFDREGLILAIDGDRPVGLVHAGFGPNSDRSWLASDTGVLSALHVAPHPDRDGIGRELLARGEAYLSSRGARQFIGGGFRPHIPFYLGVYGGSALPGILGQDMWTSELLTSAGYIEQHHRLVLERRLSGFRPPISQAQLQLRRTCQVQQLPEPPLESWWEACTVGQSDRWLFSISAKNGREPWGTILFWDMEPLASSWSVRAAGVWECRFPPEDGDDAELTVFFLAQVLLQLQTQSVGLVEVQLAADEARLLEIYRQLGFTNVDEGRVLVRSLTR